MSETISPQNSLLKVATVGANSMIGSRFCELAKSDFKLITADVSTEIQIDITNPSSVENFFKNYEFDWLVLFSAFTNVDVAEQQRGDKNGLCWQLNVEGVNNVAGACRRYNRKIVYFSTDFIFKGDSGPYSETDQPALSANEVSWYGWTKLAGEKRILSAGCQFIIARISYPFRASFHAKTDFVRNILERLADDNLYPMYVDQFLTPTFIDDIVLALSQLIKAGQTGIFNVVDNTTLSAWQAACEIARVFGFDAAKIKKGSLVESLKSNPSLAKRPLNGGLRNDKLLEFLAKDGRAMLNFDEALLKLKHQMEVASL